MPAATVPIAALFKKDLLSIFFLLSFFMKVSGMPVLLINLSHSSSLIKLTFPLMTCPRLQVNNLCRSDNTGELFNNSWSSGCGGCGVRPSQAVEKLYAKLGLRLA
jgi:hypothetical protein